MTWKSMPDTFGWWFFTPDRRTSHLAMPLAVQKRLDAAGRVCFETVVSAQRREIDPDMGWWYGPIVVARPEAA
jgi:hypothetical protein